MGVMSGLPYSATIAVVIPCFRVKAHILPLLGKIGAEVHRIIVVDDRCPEGTADHVEMHCADPRVIIHRNPVNLGVGGAMVEGYRRAIAEGIDIAVKLDGDGQMDPSLLPRFVAPILVGEADYTKGNRFHNPRDVRQMPGVRIFGNVALSFLTKLSSGYWSVFDPTNGYTAVHVAVLEQLDLDALSRRYFFESDMLFRLNTVGARVMDIPMEARYADEKSNLSIRRVLFEFPLKHARNLGKRIFYNYFLRDFSVASIELLLGLFLLVFGVVMGVTGWLEAGMIGATASAGTVMLAALPIITGVQLVLAFLAYDIASQPRHALHTRLQRGTARDGKAC